MLECQTNAVLHSRTLPLGNTENMRNYVNLARQGSSDEAKALAAAHAAETPEETKARKKSEMKERIAAKRAAKKASKEL